MSNAKRRYRRRRRTVRTPPPASKYVRCLVEAAVRAWFADCLAIDFQADYSSQLFSGRLITGTLRVPPGYRWELDE